MCVGGGGGRGFDHFCYVLLRKLRGGGHQLLCYVTTEDFFKISFPLIHVLKTLPPPPPPPPWRNIFSNLKLHYHVFAEIRISLKLMFIKLEVTPLVAIELARVYVSLSKLKMADSKRYKLSVKLAKAYSLKHTKRTAVTMSSRKCRQNGRRWRSWKMRIWKLLWIRKFQS